MNTVHAFSLGSGNPSINVYVEKAPPLHALWGEMPLTGSHTPLINGDINAIGQAGGNGWRKVFNVYAKLLFALPEDSTLRPLGFSTWQRFRDEALLQQASNAALYFGRHDLLTLADSGGIHIIAGKTHAQKLGIAEQCVWLDKDFARHPTLPIVICPYFDYRQLSNQKIDVLTKLMAKL
ncbi:hypothetical protein A1OO_18095 [Enterovibrio norvegicus FF-33]|uniref:DUF6942 family protein n=1 Tax=Enterovibrio norvegicus TaxID=188144 RepID=UPI00037D5F16|nr:hypothetical protein [Enterovibrio norvegicus]OEE67653.1 hypothetical protein A1OO_18095 [Enterovibrio norvegicus FF-33]